MSRHADDYHASLATLPDFERRLKEALDLLNDALIEKNASAVPSLRKAARFAEDALADHLSLAGKHFKAYWSARREALLPVALDAANVLRMYGVVARAAGEGHRYPGQALLEAASTNCDEPLKLAAVSDGVPLFFEDNETLVELRGAWKSWRSGSDM